MYVQSGVTVPILEYDRERGEAITGMAWRGRGGQKD